MIEQVLFKIMKEAKEKGIGSETYVKLSIMELLIFVARKAAQPETASKEYFNQMHEKVSDIVKYINKNYMERLTLAFQ